MKLSELKSLLHQHAALQFRIALPGGNPVPVSFHITEVGRVDKTFYDCGGVLRESSVCQLQIWVGVDDEHRLETAKMAGILAKGKVILPDDSIAVEIEYEDPIISQYTIQGHAVTDTAVILQLAHKHTECLAPELCGLPSFDRLPAIGSKTSCCGPNSSC